MPTPTIARPALDVVAAGETGSPQAFAQAFQFLRSHSDGRYSDRTLMTVSRWEQRSADIRENGIVVETRPAVLTLATPVSYDEDTEVKSGGTLACAVALPSSSGGACRAVVSVANDHRRRGYGAELVSRLRRLFYNPVFWVGQGNVAGQHFLLRCGMFPQRMNDSGSLMYAARRPDDEELVAR